MLKGLQYVSLNRIMEMFKHLRMPSKILTGLNFLWVWNWTNACHSFNYICFQLKATHYIFWWMIFCNDACFCRWSASVGYVHIVCQVYISLFSKIHIRTILMDGCLILQDLLVNIILERMTIQSIFFILIRILLSNTTTTRYCKWC